MPRKTCQTCNQTGRLSNGGRCPDCNPKPTRAVIAAQRRLGGVGAKAPAGDLVRRALEELR